MSAQQSDAELYYQGLPKINIGDEMSKINNLIDNIHKRNETSETFKEEPLSQCGKRKISPTSNLSQSKKIKANEEVKETTKPEYTSIDEEPKLVVKFKESGKMDIKLNEKLFLAEVYSNPIMKIDERLKNMSSDITTLLNEEEKALKDIFGDMVMKGKHLKIIGNVLIRNVFFICTKRGIATIQNILGYLGDNKSKLENTDVLERIFGGIENSKKNNIFWEKEINNRNMEILSSIPKEFNHLKAILVLAPKCYHFSYITIPKFNSDTNWVCAYTLEPITNNEKVHIIQMCCLHGSETKQHYYYVKSKPKDDLFYVNSIMLYVYSMSFTKVRKNLLFIFDLKKNLTEYILLCTKMEKRKSIGFIRKD